jgi:carbamoyltransferase
MIKQGKPIYVLGTGLSHDSSACLLKDGRICVAIEKERITRVKHDGGNDTAAIMYCLDAEGITVNDLSLVVQNANFGMLKHGTRWWGGGPRAINDSVPVVTITHHLAHAYSAIGTSPFDEAAVMVIDGCGSSMDDCLDLDQAVCPVEPPEELRHLYFEKDSYYIFKDNVLKPVYKDFSQWGMHIKKYSMYPNTTMHSIGGLYLGVSTYMFNNMEDPGKLMGLAPYGNPGKYDFEMFELKDNRAFVRYDWMSQFDDPAHSYVQLKRNFQYYADIAYWAQRELERAVLYVIKSRYEMAPSDNLCYAGGVALNAVANRRLLMETKFKNIYIQPAASDNGLAIGCAYYGWLEVLKQERVKHNGSMHLGKSYPKQTLLDLLPAYKDTVQVSTPPDFIHQTAEALSRGKTVAWFQGGAEFGPRALGSRSILADPRKPEMRDFINSKIKFREDFRPFAPSVLEEDVSIYFDCEYDSPYMILVAPVRPEWRATLPSVTHRDNSARIQTVSRTITPLYYDLISAFKRLTGISVLLNTSLNRKGMPIVETQQEAIDFFLSCELDLLVLDNYMIQKKDQKVAEPFNLNKLFNEDLKRALEHNASEVLKMRGVYRINVSSNRSWTIDLSKVKPIISEGSAVNHADTVVSIDEADLQLLQADPESDSKLLRSGKLKVDGNLSLAMNIAKIFRLKQK